jgi:glycosyltransferase involved in cell wall biosynthesis
MLAVAALVPARNEADCLPELLDRLADARVARTIVVDNGSTDSTAAIAANRGATVVRAARPGYGRACQAGIRMLLTWEELPEVLLFVDADDFLAPAQAEHLVNPILAGRADLVVGERQAVPGERGVRAHARLGNAFVTSTLRRIYGSDVKDLGPFRAVRVSCLRSLQLDDPDFGWYVQMQVRALKSGCRVIGVPVAFHARTAGESKVSGSASASVRAGIKILGTLGLEMLRKPGPAHHSPSAAA